MPEIQAKGHLICSGAESLGPYTPFDGLFQSEKVTKNVGVFGPTWIRTGVKVTEFVRRGGY